VKNGGELVEELIKQDARLFWLPPEGLEILSRCFELETEVLESSEVRVTAGRIGYLLEGEASWQADCGAERVQAGNVIGIRLGGSRGYQTSPGVLTAIACCKILWFPYDVMEFACHRNCWFHTRLILEMRRILEENQ
jgi:hypothetical protein